MLRAFVYFLKLAAVVAAAVWVVERPGAVSLQWLGYRIDTTIGVLLAALLLLLVAAGLGYRLWRFAARSPGELARAREDRRRRRGFQALSQGMVAVAAGDAAEARRLAQRTLALSREPLALLLAAQAAQLGGDEAAAARYFTAMLRRRETSFLALRGLLGQAMREGDDAKALRLALRAHDEKPNAAWAVKTLLDLRLKTGQWQAAEGTLKDAVKLKAVDAAAGRRMRALILAERALAPGRPEELLALAEEAARLAPDLVPARAAHARLLAAVGRDRAAAKAIEQAWSAAAHPELAAVYAALQPDETPLERAHRFEKLALRNPAARDSQLALGAAALEAGLWGEARRELERALAEPGALTVGLAQLMARLEEGEGADAAARRWLVAASEAAPDPAWLCERCGTPTPHWRALCGNCGAFDGLVWRQPPAARLPAALPARAQPVALPAATAPAEAEPAIEAPSVDAARLVN